MLKCSLLRMVFVEVVNALTTDYESIESGSDSEMRERQARRPRRTNRRFRRSRSRSRSPSRKNEAICMYYMQGSCQRGKGCPYSHDIQPQRKMELCKFYMMDCCAKKDKCLYMHKDFPCKHYHTGVKCKSAEKCKFSHDSLSDAARSVLLKHIELAPKDILGDFPRLTKDAAQLVVSITEAHRKGEPMDVESIPGIMDFKGRGFKFTSTINTHTHTHISSSSMRKVVRLLPGIHSHHHEERSSSESPQKNPSSSSNTASNISAMSNAAGQGGPTSNRTLGSFMTARMPQKQRELFQRIELQHSVQHEQEDTATDGALDDTPINPNNVNWYSSDEDGETSCVSKMQGQGLSLNITRNLSPSRTPPLPSPPGSSSNITTTEKQEDSPESSAAPQKGAFGGINLDNINISSDLASVLSALKNQNASSNNRNNNDDQRIPSPRGKNPRDMSRDSRETLRNFKDTSLDKDLSQALREGSRGIGDLFRAPRDVIQSPRESADYSPWQRDQLPIGEPDPWDHHLKMDSYKDQQDQHRSFLETKESSDVDHDQRLRKKDVDLRVIPGIENNRSEGANVKSVQYDTDMRISSESSIYDVDLRQLNLPNYQSSEDEVNSLPFKVPVHTPAKEIFASISSHSPMYYQLVKVTIPKPNFTHLKINKDDPRIMEDPRIRRMLKSSTEEASNRSPRAPSRYEMDLPVSPPPSKGDLKFSDADNRDPRVVSLRDPRSEGRPDPRGDVRGESRADPRTSVRIDPRVGTRGDPRCDTRDPRTDQTSDMRNQDLRMGGMFGAGNNGAMMDGGMQFMNAGPGHMGPRMPQNNMNPRDKPGLLGPAPMTISSGYPHNSGPRMPPFMMGPNSGYYSDEGGEIMGSGGYPPQGGPGWGGHMPGNDPRLKHEMGEGSRSYTPP
ncbi:Protein suppressor of sable [Chionoecetes opilio]|uniref:Protein suppressor of sable n=1 Tax=Chionoecetes opilio TaxID=41210 RepID=A0A8J4XLY9_CHIOP|nr:Protein suppressor of sable [Chionoecetes opilio]